MIIFHRPPQASNLVCTTCDESFKSADKLKAHILNLHPEEPGKFACETCGAGFVLENELETHKIRSHNSDSKSSSFICHHCGKWLSTKKSILNHIILKHIDPVYETCTICHVQIVSICGSLLAYTPQRYYFSSCRQSLCIITDAIIPCRHVDMWQPEIKYNASIVTKNSAAILC
jgi:Zinc finger, C2H2 type/C2H2-type zinc finger